EFSMPLRDFRLLHKEKVAIAAMFLLAPGLAYLSQAMFFGILAILLFPPIIAIVAARLALLYGAVAAIFLWLSALMRSCLQDGTQYVRKEFGVYLLNLLVMVLIALFTCLPVYIVQKRTPNPPS